MSIKSIERQMKRIGGVIPPTTATKRKHTHNEYRRTDGYYDGIIGKKSWHKNTGLGTFKLTTPKADSRKDQHRKAVAINKSEEARRKSNAKRETWK